MASILILGKARELLAGELPLGVSTEEVNNLAELRDQLDDRGALILADPALLGAERQSIEAWLKAGGARNALVVAVVELGEADEVLGRFSFLDDVVVRPATSPRLRLRLERSLEVIHNRRAIQQLQDSLTHKKKELRELNSIGVALSGERDINKLLNMILVSCREITAADAGSLYLVERGPDDESSADDLLRFKLAQNDSVPVAFTEFTMPLDDTSIAGYAANRGTVVNVQDAYHLSPDSPYKYGRSFDEKSGYRTKSVLAVPMRDHRDTVIGVVQLINKKRDARAILKPVDLVEEMVIPFTSTDQELVKSLASQAAVALENAHLIKEIKGLFESFVQASVITIEKRDPVTSGHSGRVADLTVELAEKVDAATSGPFHDRRFTREQIQEIRYASLLHDFGKVAVQEKYLIKGKKLYDSGLELVGQRFAYIQRTLQVEHLEARMRQMEAGASPSLLAEMDADFQARREQVAQLWTTIKQANEPTILEEESAQTLLDLPRRFYPDIDGAKRPFLTEQEMERLSVRRGSLTAEERGYIEKHVEETYNFLEKLPWTSELKKVPDFAGKHHAKLDGSGYPRKVLEDGQVAQKWEAHDIPIQSRMMTISDIYDALTAWNRPYKKAVPWERALDILVKEEAGRGRIDADLLDLFIGAKVYEKTMDWVLAVGEAAPIAGKP
jgi:HD-GYP domain-containing protein (c-di-GMP phosphodiesterase class II)